MLMAHPDVHVPEQFTHQGGRLTRFRARGGITHTADRLVWTEPDAGMTTTITFAELADGRTEVVTHQANVPAAYRSPGAQQGFRTSLDRCAAYVASLTRKE
jgi:activator of Hsp90 ATPase-like protein